MMKKIFFIINFIFIISCNQYSTYTKPDFYFKGKFDTSLVDQVDAYIKSVASSRGLKVIEKKRDEMKVLTKGQEAFFVALTRDTFDRSVLFISNVGVGNVLTLDLYSQEDFSKEDTKKLAEEVVDYLSKEFKIEMMAVNPDANGQHSR